MKPSTQYSDKVDELENRRLQALYSYKILDTPRESSFDDLTQSVARSLNVPYAKIAFIDKERIWCKSTVGFTFSDAPVRGSIAQLALNNPTETVLIKDLSSHSSILYPSRLVDDPNIKSAIGFPIVSIDGYVLGILAAFDTKVREFCGDEILLMQNRSKQITEMIEDKRDADLLLDTLLEQREELRSKTISNRIARTLIGSVATSTELENMLNEFIEATIQEFGWWAGQAWIENEEEYKPCQWILSHSAPLSIVTLNKYSNTSISSFGDSKHESIPYSSDIHSDLDIDDLAWHPHVKQIEKVGARSFVELTINGCSDTALKILFLLPNPRALTHSLYRVLENLITLLPQIMKRAKTVQNLIHQATHDSLTGLLNRRGLEEAYPDALIDTNGSYYRSVLFFDIDSFKEINDTYGHSVGDAVLVEISKRLINCSRPVDTVARIGGDEFVMITPGFDSEESLESTTKRLLNDISAPLLINQDERIEIQFSIGISFMRSHHSLENALKRADTLMYKGKELGGNNFVIEEANTKDTIDTELLSSHKSHIAKIQEITLKDNQASGELYICIDLPTHFSPVTMLKIAESINRHLESKNITEKPTLIINAPISGNISRSNLEALFDALGNIYGLSQLVYCIDQKLRNQNMINFAKQLNSQGLVRLALLNFGCGENELQSIQEFQPSYFLIGHKVLSDDNLKNKITLKIIITISEAMSIPIVIFEDANDSYNLILSHHKDLRTIRD